MYVGRDIFSRVHTGSNTIYALVRASAPEPPMFSRVESRLDAAATYDGRDYGNTRVQASERASLRAGVARREECTRVHTCTSTEAYGRARYRVLLFAARYYCSRSLAILRLASFHWPVALGRVKPTTRKRVPRRRAVYHVDRDGYYRILPTRTTISHLKPRGALVTRFLCDVNDRSRCSLYPGITITRAYAHTVTRSERLLTLLRPTVRCRAANTIRVSCA